MHQSRPEPNCGNITITVIPEPSGRYICEVTPSLEGSIVPTKKFHGQTPKHAIAIAFEDLARTFRREAEADQMIDGDAVDRSPSGTVNEKRFHVIPHYERIADEASKFEALVSMQLGHTVIENAEITLVQSIRPCR